MNNIIAAAIIVISLIILISYIISLIKDLYRTLNEWGTENIKLKNENEQLKVKLLKNTNKI